MEYRSMNVPALTIGLDLGDKRSHLFALSSDGEIVADEKIATTPGELTKRFGDFPTARVAMEAGTHSRWVSELLGELGHQVLVANPAALGNKRARRKNDRMDARTLARRARSDPQELSPIRHRGRSAQLDLAVIRARDCLVRTRTLQINTVRSIVKSFGGRLPTCSGPAFVKKVRDEIPKELRPALQPLLLSIDSHTYKITEFDKQIRWLAKKEYPETRRLTQVTGVSDLTALTYVLTLEDHRHFAHSRVVGAFVGLVPGLSESGEGSPQLRISKAGDAYLRRLMVTAAQYILGHFGTDCDLRRHGEAISQRGGKNAKKRAVIAVARKLTVLLHRLWASGDTYDPFYNAKRKKEAA